MRGHQQHASVQQRHWFGRRVWGMRSFRDLALTISTYIYIHTLLSDCETSSDVYLDGQFQFCQFLKKG